MRRRHFIQISATASVALLFSRLTSSAANAALLINMPDEVWAKSGDNWYRLKPSGEATYTYKDIQVRLKPNADAVSYYVSSPSMPLKAVRLKWSYELPPVTKLLGDKWERSYGDLSWALVNSVTINPWYILVNDGQHTACFGVKTGCNAICWWSLKDTGIEMTMDTSCGGVGVQLGQRELHAADVITTKRYSYRNTV